MNALTSWACPVQVDKKGEYAAGGCGGNWGEVMPERCPRCKGPLVVTQTVHVLDLGVVA